MTTYRPLPPSLTSPHSDLCTSVFVSICFAQTSFLILKKMSFFSNTVIKNTQMELHTSCMVFKRCFEFYLWSSSLSVIETFTSATWMNIRWGRGGGAKKTQNIASLSVSLSISFNIHILYIYIHIDTKPHTHTYPYVYIQLAIFVSLLLYEACVNEARCTLMMHLYAARIGKAAQIP